MHNVQNSSVSAVNNFEAVKKGRVLEKAEVRWKSNGFVRDASQKHIPIIYFG